MARGREMSENDRNHAVRMSSSGKSIRQIEKILNLPKSTIADCLKNYRERGNVTVLPRTGRPQVMDKRDNRTLRRIIKSNRRGTVEQITNEYNINIKKKTSRSTCLRQIHRLGYNFYKVFSHFLVLSI